MSDPHTSNYCSRTNEEKILYWTAGQAKGLEPNQVTKLIWRLKSSGKNGGKVTAMTYTNWGQRQPDGSGVNTTWNCLTDRTTHGVIGTVDALFSNWICKFIQYTRCSWLGFCSDALSMLVLTQALPYVTVERG